MPFFFVYAADSVQYKVCRDEFERLILVVMILVVMSNVLTETIFSDNHRNKLEDFISSQ